MKPYVDREVLAAMEQNKVCDVVIEVQNCVDTFLDFYLELGREFDKLGPEPHITILPSIKHINCFLPPFLIEKYKDDPRLTAIWWNCPIFFNCQAIPESQAVQIGLPVAPSAPP